MYSTRVAKADSASTSPTSLTRTTITIEEMWSWLLVSFSCPLSLSNLTPVSLFLSLDFSIMIVKKCWASDIEFSTTLTCGTTQEYQRGKLPSRAWITAWEFFPLLLGSVFLWYSAWLNLAKIQGRVICSRQNTPAILILVWCKICMKTG